MKIRKGFVSNSSTSSFCIYGTYLHGVEFTDEFKKLYEEENTSELMEILECDYGLDVECNSWDYGSQYICAGIDMAKMPRDKTLEELDKVLEKKFEKIGKVKKFQAHQEAWRDS